MSTITEIPITDHMRVKHGMKAHFVLKSGNRVLEDELMDIGLVGGHITLVSIMYNRLSVSGGCAWWDPKTDNTIAKPKYTISVDETQVLTGDQVCDCSKCGS
jgi:hypothetical protein